MQGGNNIFANWGSQNAPQEVLAKIADIVGAPVFITKNGGFGLYDQKIIYANQAFCKITGYEPTEVIGRSPEFLYSQRGGGDVVLDFYKSCNAGQPFKIDFESFTKSATQLDVTAEVTPVISNEQNSISYVVFLSKVEEVQAEIAAKPEIAQEIEKVQITESLPDEEDLSLVGIVSAEYNVEEEFDVPLAPIVTAEIEPEIEEIQAPQEEIVTTAPTEAENRRSILEEIKAELRGEIASEFAKEKEVQNPSDLVIQTEDEEDPFGLEDYEFDDTGDDLKEEYKVDAEPEIAEEAPKVQIQPITQDNSNVQFFSRLGQVLSEDKQQTQVPDNQDTQEEASIEEEIIAELEEETVEMSVEDIVSEIKGHEEEIIAAVSEEDPTIAGTPEAEPYQNSQIAELIKKLEEKKEEASKQDKQIQQVKDDSSDPEIMEQDLDYYAKARFLSNMSHDLRTPLNAIIGFSEVIRDQLFGPIDNQRYISYANDIYKSGQELLATVSEILELSEIEDEESPLEEEDFSLTNIIDEVLDLLSARAFQTDVKLLKKLKAENIGCRGDRRKIKQAIAGVINNAIKSSPSGGTLELSSEMNEEGFQMMIYIRSANMIAAKSNLGSLLGTVTSKIESEYPEILLAHKFIEAHGGEFSIFNSATSGTEISITLPADRLSRDASGQDYLKVIS